jgi:hypothetical protein
MAVLKQYERRDRPACRCLGQGGPSRHTIAVHNSIFSLAAYNGGVGRGLGVALDVAVGVGVGQPVLGGSVLPLM